MATAMEATAMEVVTTKMVEAAAEIEPAPDSRVEERPSVVRARAVRRRVPIAIARRTIITGCAGAVSCAEAGVTQAPSTTAPATASAAITFLPRVMAHNSFNP
jgi:hypothetical protein